MTWSAPASMQLSRPSSTGAARWAPLLVGLAVLGQSAPASAQVKLKTKEDGRTLIYNETPVDMARRTSTRLLAPPSSELASLLERHSRRQRLSLDLVRAVVQVESGYNSRALSRKGAMGLMQLMPDTAREFGVTDAYDAEQNVRAGTAYLRQLLNRFEGRLSWALAAYNAGPTAVDRFGGIPPYSETQAYVAKVLALHNGSPPSALLQDYARDQAKLREAAQARAPRQGERVYLVRGPNNRVVLTTTPPRPR